MIHTIYVEDAVRNHPRTTEILGRFSSATVVACERYGEVFNPRGQNFRMQKMRPALILAHKPKNFVLPAPEGYGIGGESNYYFSHMLNCIYDCRYCFLQGMYQSAHYVLFVNYEDFCADIVRTAAASPEGENTYFFSGYDCDSLALDDITGFVRGFLPVFRQHPRAFLELRTKSAQIRALMDEEPIDNCAVAFSMSPDVVAKAVEDKTPSVRARLSAMKKLAERGWRLGLRFDPLIYHEGFRESYADLFRAVFEAIPMSAVHSVSLGPLRFPRKMFDTIARLYPEERLFAGPLETVGSMVSYRSEIEAEMDGYCRELLRGYVPESLFFSCTPRSS